MWSSIYLIEKRSGWSLNRRMYLQQDTITLYDDKCVQCDICINTCPKEALSFPEEEGTRQLRIDPDKCSFCGACSASCLFKAIRQTKNEKIAMPVVEYEAFPRLLGGSMALDERRQKCNGCGTCVISCPRGAIEILYTPEGPTLMNDVEKCAGCLTCEANCPFEIVNSHSVFTGEFKLEHEKCDPNCSKCISKCPMDALYRLDVNLESKGAGLVFWDEHSCTYCRACEFVCPEKCIAVKRTVMKVFPDVFMTPAFEEAKKKLLSK
ncbi:MAG: 4Fe-4S dicluster domain-containing protein [Candidatus Odinarchaeota archaeon]